MFQESKRRNQGFIIGVFVGAFFFGMLTFFIAHAFNGPTNAPGVGSGAIGIGSSTNDVSIGTSSPSASIKTLIIGSTTDSSAYALEILQSNTSPILYVRNDGAVSIATTTVTAGTLTLQGNFTVSGSINGGSEATAIPASNITGGAFSSNETLSNFAFPESLGINTSSQVGLPQALSVYGNGFFTGDLNSVNVSSSLASGNAFFGDSAGSVLTGSNNTALGVGALGAASNNSNDVALGFNAGKSASGSNSVFLGYGAGYSLTGSNLFELANASSGAPLAYGNFSNGQFAINTTTLNVNPGLTIAGGLSISQLSSSGNPCLSVGSTGVVATSTCGGSSLSGGQTNFIPLWTGTASLGTSTLQATTSALVTTGGFAIGTTTNQAAGNLLVTGNETTTNLTVSALGSSGSPCLSVTSAGVLSTTTCGSALSGGSNNFIPLWTGASTLSTSTLQQNGTTTYTLNGFAIGTSTLQGAGNLTITGSYLGGTLSASQVTSNAFPSSGNFAFPTNLNIGTSSTLTASTLSVYGTSLVTGLGTFSSSTIFNGSSTHTATTTFAASTIFTGSVNAASGTTFQVPVAAGPTINTSGSIAYDANHNMLEYGDGNATGTVPRTIFFKALPAWVNGGTSASDTIVGAQASTTEAAFQTNYTIPANYLIANKTLELSFGLQVVSGATQANQTIKVELRKAGVATTTIYSSNTTNAACSAINTTCGIGATLYITALTSPTSNASITVSCASCGGGTAANILNLNKTAEPVAVDTTSNEVLQITTTYAANDLTTSSLIMYNLEEVN